MSGGVSFSPGGESEWSQAVVNRPLINGDRLWVAARRPERLGLLRSVAGATVSLRVCAVLSPNRGPMSAKADWELNEGLASYRAIEKQEQPIRAGGWVAFFHLPAASAFGAILLDSLSFKL